MGRIAVLTGDIVGSGKLPAGKLEPVLGEITAAFRTIRSWNPRADIVGPAIFRGDSWQAATDDIRLALRAAIHVRARLIAQDIADTRIAIAIADQAGELSEPVSSLSGEAFVLSGKALDAIGKGRLVLTAPDTGDDTVSFAATIVDLCDALVTGWTSRQAQLVARAVHPDDATLETISREAPGTVSVQTVSTNLQRAFWPVLENALATVESSKWLN